MAQMPAQLLPVYPPWGSGQGTSEREADLLQLSRPFPSLLQAGSVPPTPLLTSLLLPLGQAAPRLPRASAIGWGSPALSWAQACSQRAAWECWQLAQEPLAIIALTSHLPQLLEGVRGHRCWDAQGQRVGRAPAGLTPCQSEHPDSQCAGTFAAMKAGRGLNVH